MAAGRPPLGFLNPLIYYLGDDAFNDIKVGNAPGCGTPGFHVSGTTITFWNSYEFRRGLFVGSGNDRLGSCDRLGNARFREAEETSCKFLEKAGGVAFVMRM